MTGLSVPDPPAPQNTRRTRLPEWMVAALCAIASALLLAGCYWPLHLHFLAWFALVPWLTRLPRLSPGRAWLYGTLLGLLFYRIGLAWLLTIAGPLGGIAIVGLAAWMGFSFRVTNLLIARLGHAAILWAMPLCFVGQEVLRSEGLAHYRFAYMGLGYSQSHAPWIAQLASIGGVYCLSALIVAFNSALAFGILTPNRLRWIPAGGLAAAILLLGLLSQPGFPTPTTDIVVACVQGEDLTYDEYLDLTRQAAEMNARLDVIVLPEHALAEYAHPRNRLIQGLAEIASLHDLAICIGAHLRASPDADCAYDNVTLLITPEIGITGSQAKVVPVPFFEDGNPARTLETFKTSWGQFGLFICYDGTFTDIPRRLVDLGAQCFLVPVFDAERWPDQQMWLHADMAPFRSIECRRGAVRAASSGLSQIIDATGTILHARTRAEGPGIISGVIQLRDTRTLFVRGGHWFGTLASVAFLAAVAALTLGQWWITIVRRRRTKAH